MKLFTHAILLFSLIFPLVTSTAINVEVTAIVPGCGNSIIESGEQCDGGNLGSMSCSALGYSGGSLSCSGACTFNTSACVTTPGGSGGGGGGGGGVGIIPSTNVVFKGSAYPGSRVLVLKDAQVVGNAVAGADGAFQVSVSGMSGGSYAFSLYAEDTSGVRSSSLTFPLSITANITKQVTGILISPTISANKSEVKKGDPITISGFAVPNSQVAISVKPNGGTELIFTRTADSAGRYSISLDTTSLAVDTYVAKAKSGTGTETTAFGNAISFIVGTKNVDSLRTNSFLKGDLNKDDKVNLVDFSIAAYWYKRTLSEEFVPTEVERLNGDGKVDLVDFSIIAFHWTGG